MNKKREEKGIYDSVFDFLWGVQKSKQNKPFPKRGEQFSGYSSALVEIGTQPLIFPLEQSFSNIDKNIEKATSVKLGNMKKYGLDDTGKIGFNLRKAINQQGELRPPNDQWYRVGGGLHVFSDSALISFYSKHSGASSQTAYKAGQLFGKVLQDQIVSAEKGSFEYRKKNADITKMGKGLISGKSFEEIESYMRDQYFEQEAVDLLANSIHKTNPGIKTKDLKKLIKDLQTEPSRRKRLDQTKLFFQRNSLSTDKSTVLSKLIWGEMHTGNLGLYRADFTDISSDIDKRVRSFRIDPGDIARIKEIVRTQGEFSDKETQIKTILQAKIDDNLRARDLIADELQNNRRPWRTTRNQIRRIVNSYGFAFTNAEINNMIRASSGLLTRSDLDDLVTRKLRGKQIKVDQIAVDLESSRIAAMHINDGKTMALNSINYANANEYFYKNGITDPTFIELMLRANSLSFMTNPSTKAPFGARIETDILRLRWLAQSGTWGSTLLSGKWEDFAEDTNLAELVKEIKVKKHGVETGETFFASADTVAGRLFGSFYYLHPTNFIRGAFFDGSLWLKLASDPYGNVDTTKFAYFLSQMSFNNLFAPYRKGMQIITNKIYDIFAPYAVSLKRTINMFLRKMLGLTGVSGWIASWVIDKVGRNIAYALNRVVTVVIVGFFAAIAILILAIFSGFDNGAEEKRIESTLPHNLTIEKENSGTTFTDLDFGVER